MTSPDRLAEMAAEAEAELRAKFGDAAVEILRLRARDLAAFDEIRHLRARIAELEGNLAVTFGTMERPTPDEPATITHGHPPSAPPHDKPRGVIEINRATAMALEAINSPEPENGDE